MPRSSVRRARFVPFVLLLASGCAHADAPPPPLAAPLSSAAAPAAEPPVEQEAEAAPPVAPASRLQRGRTAPRLALQETARAAPGDEPPGPANQSLIVSGRVTVRTGDVAALVRAIRDRTSALGGTVVGEEMRGDPREGLAQMRLRLPPETATPFVDWLTTQATLETRDLEISDVSRTYLDQELALRNLRITMGRLQELAARPNTALKDVLEVERELTRVRGEIERIEGEHRGLADRIARATLAVTILPAHRAQPLEAGAEPELKFELTPHVNVLHFLDQRASAQTRVGGGVSLMFSRAFALDFTALPRDGAAARSFLFSFSLDATSDFLGGGRRRTLNPYLGLRAGGGSVNDHGTFVFGAEAGLELLRYQRFLLDVTGRALGFVYGSGTPNDVVFEGVAAVGVPF
jgi:hypothetical protein